MGILQRATQRQSFHICKQIPDREEERETQNLKPLLSVQSASVNTGFCVTSRVFGSLKIGPQT